MNKKLNKYFNLPEKYRDYMLYGMLKSNIDNLNSLKEIFEQEGAHFEDLEEVESRLKEIHDTYKIALELTKTFNDDFNKSTEE